MASREPDVGRNVEALRALCEMAAPSDMRVALEFLMIAEVRSLATALLMSASVTAVLAASSLAISLIRSQIPRSVRLIIQITIISSLVIVTDQVLRTFAFELSRQRRDLPVGLL